jgi:hypothetical protein
VVVDRRARLAPLIDRVLEVVLRVGDDPIPVRPRCRASSSPLVLHGSDGWPEMRRLGATPRWREPGEVSWGLELVDTALRVRCLPANADTRREVVQGLVDLLANRPPPAQPP